MRRRACGCVWIPGVDVVAVKEAYSQIDEEPAASNRLLAAGH